MHFYSLLYIPHRSQPPCFDRANDISDVESRDSSVCIATGYGQDGRPSISRKGQEIILFSTASRPALGPTKPSIQRLPGVLSPRVKRQGSEADHSPPSSAEVKNGGAMPPLPHKSSWHNA
jgi:hypothetical protein